MDHLRWKTAAARKTAKTIRIDNERDLYVKHLRSLPKDPEIHWMVMAGVDLKKVFDYGSNFSVGGKVYLSNYVFESSGGGNARKPDGSFESHVGLKFLGWKK